MNIPTPAEKRNLRKSVRAEAFRLRVAQTIHDSRRMPITIALSTMDSHGEYDSRTVAEIVMAEVREKGWKAKIVSDDRDGDYLEITE